MIKLIYLCIGSKLLLAGFYIPVWDCVVNSVFFFKKINILYCERKANPRKSSQFRKSRTRICRIKLLPLSINVDWFGCYLFPCLWANQALIIGSRIGFWCNNNNINGCSICFVYSNSKRELIQNLNFFNYFLYCFLMLHVKNNFL
jgi:hypothetical protein